MQTRIPGIDLARAWAIFGMLIVNFNYVFGNLGDPSWLGWFNALFSGNSSALFVILAGMGVSMRTFRLDADAAEKRRLRRLVFNRSWFLFVLGIALYPVWPGDILHFYGGYMHLAALLLFVSDRWLWGAILLVQAVFYLLFWLIPYENGWNFETYSYLDFWSVAGFFRNTFYNGWNPIFPWASYFLLGMWLGRRDWSAVSGFRRQAIWASAAIYGAYVAALLSIEKMNVPDSIRWFVNAEYTPPFLPFMVGCASSAVATIVIFRWLGDRFSDQIWARVLAATGQLTLTNYLLHCTVGMVLLGKIASQAGPFPSSPGLIFGFSTAWFLMAAGCSFWWKNRFGIGPFERLMRRITG